MMVTPALSRTFAAATVFLLVSWQASAGDSSLVQIRTLLDAGQYTQAAALAETAVGRATSREDGVVARQLWLESLLRDGRGSEARTLELARPFFEGRLASTARPASLRLAGSVLLESGRFRAAAQLLGRAAAADRSGGNPLDLASDLDGLTTAAIWLEDFQRAGGSAPKPLRSSGARDRPRKSSGRCASARSCGSGAATTPRLGGSSTTLRPSWLRRTSTAASWCHS